MMVLLVSPAVFGADAGGAPRRFLRIRPVAWLGLISYGVYLWHLPIALWLASSNSSQCFADTQPVAAHTGGERGCRGDQLLRCGIAVSPTQGTTSPVIYPDEGRVLGSSWAMCSSALASSLGTLPATCARRYHASMLPGSSRTTLSSIRWAREFWFRSAASAARSTLTSSSGFNVLAELS